MPAGTRITLIAAAALLAACTTAAGTTAPMAAASPPVVARATLLAADGANRGSAVVSASGAGLELHIEAAGLPAGPHGVHLHTTGRCDGPAFASAGGHLNPHAKMHGTDNPQGSHLGDLPNLIVAADGTATATIALSGARAELEPLLFDGDGTAVVVHAGPDDYKTDPSGNSGGRVACGVLTRP